MVEQFKINRVGEDHSWNLPKNIDYYITMIKGRQFVEMALSFSGTEQVPHFERIGFKVTGRRMFSTYLEKDNTANIFLTPKEQAVFCQMDKAIYPVPNKWGEKGATTFELDHVPQHIVVEALLSAYTEVINLKGGKTKRK
jgi:hypothetical protein